MTMTYESNPGDPLPPDALVCVRCGYELSGIPVEGNCPECGLAVERSVALGKALRDSRPGWIRSIAWAARLGLLCYAAISVGVLAPLVVMDESFADFVFPAAIFVMAACRLPQVMLMWRRENPHARKQIPWVRQSILTFLTLIQFGATLISVVVIVTHGQWQTFFTGRDVEKLLTAAGVCFGLSSSFEFSLLHRLARRVLDPRLIEHTTIVGIGLTTSIVIVSMSVFHEATRPYNRTMTDLDTAMLLIAATAMLLFWIWAVYVLWYLSRSLFAAARQASNAWIHADAAEKPA